MFITNYLARNFSRFKCALVKCEIARDDETLLYDPQVIITSVYTPYFKNDDTVELHWLEHLWNHKKMFETGVVRANDCFHSARPGGIIGISF